MFALRRLAMVAAYLAGAMASTSAFAGAKDENAAEWLAPKWLNEWHDGLAAKGLNFGATWIGDNITNVSGGTSRGAIHFGRLDLSVDADLEKLVGWTGGRFYANTLGIYGRGLSRNYVHNLATISEIEALPEARLYNAYFEQSFYNNALNYQDRPAGRRRRVLRQPDRRPLHQRHVRLAGHQGQQPSRRRTGAADRGARHPRQGRAVGPGHRVRRGVQRQCGAAGRRRPAAARQSRPGVSRQRSAVADRAGALELRSRLRRPVRWPAISRRAAGIIPASSTISASPRKALSIADPGGTGIAAKLRGNFGIFAVVEQTLYRPASVTEKGVSASLPGVTAFARIAYSPPDRNLIDLYVDGGIGVSGLVPGRPLDRFGMAVAYMRISNAARNLDRDTQFFTGLPSPVRSNETLVEMIYEAHLKPGWLLAPYFQYVFRPSGGIPNPNDPSGLSRIGDAAVFGVTTTLRY